MGRLFPVGNEGTAFPEQGEEQGAPRIAVRTIDLSVARNKVPIEIGGNFLWAADASDNSATITVSFARDTADDGFPFKSGVRISGQPFSRLIVTNAAQAGKSITFVYALEAGRRGLEIDNAAGDFSSVALVQPSASTTDPDETLAATAESTIPANTDRTRLVVEADIDNTTDLRVGTTVADATGLRLTPGAQQEFKTTEAVIVRNPTGGASADFRWFEEEAP